MNEPINIGSVPNTRLHIALAIDIWQTKNSHHLIPTHEFYDCSTLGMNIS